MHAAKIQQAKELSEAIRSEAGEGILSEERSAAQQIMAAAVDLEAANLRRAKMAEDAASQPK